MAEADTKTNPTNSVLQQENDLKYRADSTNSTNEDWENQNAEVKNNSKTAKILTVFGRNFGPSETSKKKWVFRKMYIAALAALMNALCMGYGATYTATALADMSSRNASSIHPTKDEEGWIGSLLPVGALVGGLVAGNLAQTLGRRGALLFSTVPFVGGWLFIVFATSVPFLYVGRLIIGFCCGLVSVTTPMYLVEISTPEVRGLLGASFQLFVTVGILFVSCIGSLLPWHLTAVLGGTLSVTTLLIMIFIPESPRWLMAKGKVEKAKKSIQWLQGNFLDASDLCKSIQEDIDNQPQGNITFRELLAPDAYKPILLSFALMFFQQCSGVNAILFYTVNIFKKSGSSLEGTTATILVATVQVLSTLLSSILMDRAGRKALLLLSGFIMTFSFGIFGCFDYLASKLGDHIRNAYGWLPILCLIFFISAFSLGYGPIPWLMVSEMTSARLRSRVSGAATALNWAFAFAVTKSFNSMSKGLHDFGVYFTYMTICAISCFFTAKFVLETKGKTLEEIQEHFKRKSKPSFVVLSEKPIATISEKV